MPKSATTFKPGQSGNPGGRSPRVGPNGETVAQLARKHTARAIDTLVELLGEEQAADVRLKAAEALLNRGWGKPQESVEVTGELATGLPVIQIMRYDDSAQDRAH